MRTNSWRRRSPKAWSPRCSADAHAPLKPRSLGRSFMRRSAERGSGRPWAACARADLRADGIERNVERVFNPDRKTRIGEGGNWRAIDKRAGALLYI
jgi:hypothetical protein